jgi:hypothetical protein
VSDVVRLVMKETIARPGETFSCVVLLDPNDERVSRAKSLDIVVQWRAWRSGVASMILEHRTVAKWSAELPLRMEYTAKLTLPEDAPVTFRGSLVSIDWVVFAALDVPFKLDPSATLALRVLPRGAAADSSHVRPWQVPNPLEK